MKSFGWETAFGEKIAFPNGGGSLTIVGAIKDFHLSSLQEPILLLSLYHVKDNRAYRYLTVRLHKGNLTNAISLVKAKWKEINPNSVKLFKNAYLIEYVGAKKTRYKFNSDSSTVEEGVKIFP